MTIRQKVKESRWYSVLEISNMLNLSARRIQQLAKEGHIPQGRRGRYELVPTVQGYTRYLQRLAADRSNTASAHAAEVLKQRAEKLKRENELAAGEFIPRGDVAVGIQAAVDHITERMLAIPPKAAPEALAAESVGDVKVILQEHIHRALDELYRTRFVAVGEAEPTPTRKPVKRRRKPAR
jgi:hypothetical protein